MARKHKTNSIAVDQFRAVDRIPQRPKNQENIGKGEKQANTSFT